MKKIYLLLLAFALSTLTVMRAQTWTAMGTGIQGIVTAITSYNGNLYVAGQFDTAGGQPAANVAMWDGTQWHALGAGVTGSGAWVYNMTVYNGELYVGGEFDSAGNMQVSNLAIWNGTQWSVASGGINGPYPEITCMAVYNNQLIVAGNFNRAGSLTVQNIAAWNGSNWSSLDTTTLWTSLAMIDAMCVWNGDLYVGSEGVGGSDSAGTSIGSWNGTSWTVLQDSTITKNSDVNVLSAYNGRLYAGGTFYKAALDTVTPDVAIYSGSGWQSLGVVNNESVESFGVDVLAGYNNELYAGGYFWDINGQSDSLLSTYDGISWNQVHVSLTARAVAYYASYVWNGSLYLGGIFNIAAEGGNVAISVVKYTEGTNAIKPVNYNGGLKLYPDPAGNQLVIEGIMPGTPVVINNLLGQTVAKIIAESNTQIMDVAALSPGMYFINGAKFVKE